ncbi:MAG: glycosyltransferase [Actinomycetota bacterium]|nr:glycosyltransferase [Actinomycetota bacterium]MDA3028789.1 glycosyltransferase [Actinomycetota bacterium]
MSVQQPVTLGARDLIASALSLRHLDNLTGRHGIFEHARHSVIRPEHGLCTDDNARLAVLIARLGGVGRTSIHGVERLRDVSARFVLDAVAADGRVRNRRHAAGRWLDEPHIGDNWGRAVHALGVIASSDDNHAALALDRFNRSASHRTLHLRSMCHASLGAAALLERIPGHSVALDLLADTADLIWSASASAEWPWPEPRLTYANAVIPEALIAAAAALGRSDELVDALAMLRWLVGIETEPGHLSPTPAVGRALGDTSPGFDQQPIEVAAIASAAARAMQHHADPLWDEVLRRSVGWFLGENDRGSPMIDGRTGGGYDGLTVDGVNLNQGAESTIAMLETLVVAARGATGR